MLNLVVYPSRGSWEIYAFDTFWSESLWPKTIRNGLGSKNHVAVGQKLRTYGFEFWATPPNSCWFHHKSPSCFFLFQAFNLSVFPIFGPCPCHTFDGPGAVHRTESCAAWSLQPTWTGWRGCNFGTQSSGAILSREIYTCKSCTYSSFSEISYWYLVLIFILAMLVNPCESLSDICICLWYLVISIGWRFWCLLGLKFLVPHEIFQNQTQQCAVGQCSSRLFVGTPFSFLRCRINLNSWKVRCPLHTSLFRCIFLVPNFQEEIYFQSWLQFQSYQFGYGSKTCCSQHHSW